MSPTPLRSRPYRARWDAAIVSVGVLMMMGCSVAPTLSAEQRTEADQLVAERSVVAMIELSEQDRGCVVDQMAPVDLEALRGGEAQTVAELVVSCVGQELIGTSVLQSQIGEISPQSLECAVSELDRAFVVDLVAGSMTERVPRAPVEIELARVLSLCLELEELL